MASHKLVLIGLDGVPYDFLASMVDRGLLPNFRRLFKQSAHGVLHSTIPPLSSVAWASIMTGLNPGKHGIFAFLDRSGRPYSSRNVMGRTIWDICSASRKRVICLNVPVVTNPPYPVRGVMVPGFSSPPKSFNTYPPGLSDELKDAVDYEVDIPLWGPDLIGLSEAEFVRYSVRITKARADAIFYLAEKLEWDLLCAVFTTPDRIQHVFFGRATRDSPFYEPGARYVLEGYYRLLDKIVGKLLSEFSSEAMLMFLSDYGFEPCFKYVNIWHIIVRFLTGHGPSGLSEHKSNTLMRILARAEVFKAFDLLNRLLMGRVGLLQKRSMKRAIEAVAKQAVLVGETRRRADGFICGAETVAFIYTDHPLVRYLEKLVQYLYDVFDEETGRPVIGGVYSKEDIYRGPFLKTAPELVILPSRGYEFRLGIRGELEEIRPVKGMTYRTGTHASPEALRGFFAILGNGIQEGIELDASAYDITPTALHILDLPVPHDTDGRVLTDAFSRESPLFKRSIMRQRTGLRRRLAVRIGWLRTSLRRGKPEAEDKPIRSSSLNTRCLEDGPSQ